MLLGGIPIEELSKLRLRVSKLVDRGNTILGQDVVIRNEEGVPLDVESLSLLRTYEAHISSKGRVGSLMVYYFFSYKQYIFQIFSGRNLKMLQSTIVSHCCSPLNLSNSIVNIPVK